MSKTIVVVGFGPGISTAVAEKFGAGGFSVALVARNAVFAVPPPPWTMLPVVETWRNVRLFICVP